MWKYNKFRTRVLLSLVDEGQIVGSELLAYFPYRYYCADVFSADQIIQIGSFGFSQLNDSSFYIPSFDYEKHDYFRLDFSKSSFFRPNIPKNLRQCELKLAYSAWPPYVIDMSKKDGAGFEGEYIYLLAEKLNVKFKMTKYFYRDGNMLHLLGNANHSIKMERDFKLIVRDFRLRHIKRLSDLKYFL